MAHVESRRDEVGAAASRPRLERSRDDRMVAGVAGGIARHLGVSSTVLRIGFAISVFAAGFGVIVYVLTWLLAPMEADDPTASGANRTPRRLRMPSIAQLVGIGLLAIGVAVILAISGLWFGGAQGWPVLVAAIGFAILWARRGDEGRGRLTLPGLGAPIGSVVSGPVS
jgi:phage shock protein PspC (stress-responsive transcriptional regulator)